MQCYIALNCPIQSIPNYNKSEMAWFHPLVREPAKEKEGGSKGEEGRGPKNGWNRGSTLNSPISNETWAWEGLFYFC